MNGAQDAGPRRITYITSLELTGWGKRPITADAGASRRGGVYRQFAGWAAPTRGCLVEWGIERHKVPDFIAGYNIIKKLGDGARSHVYQVVNADTGEVFALKRVVRDSSEDTRFLEQAINEHEISIRFDHKFLRVSYELHRIRKMLKLTETQTIMEFVDGVGMDRARPTRIDKTVDIFLCVAEGLHHMHERGYLHTDIKPNNILLTFTGGVKIIDFGQACEIGFRKPRIQGTPDYIAPEQVNRMALTKPTDVFNFGATLYWALTGQSYPTLITKTGKRQEIPDQAVIPTPSALNPEIPAVLSRLVMECCEYESFRRPKDMHEVFNRLDLARHVVLSRIDDAGGESVAMSAGADGDPLTHAAGQWSDAPDDMPGTVDIDPDDADDRYDYSAFDEFESGPDTDRPARGGPPPESDRDIGETP